MKRYVCARALCYPTLPYCSAYVESTKNGISLFSGKISLTRATLIDCKLFQLASVLQRIGLWSLAQCTVAVKALYTWWLYNNIMRKAASFSRNFFFLKNLCPQSIVKNIYTDLVNSKLSREFDCWGGTYVSYLNPLLTLKQHYIWILLGKNVNHSSIPLFKIISYVPLTYSYLYK